MEFIQCSLCSRHFEEITTNHLKAEHGGMTLRQYGEVCPEASIMTDELYRGRSTNIAKTWTPSRREQHSQILSGLWTPEERTKQSERMKEVWAAHPERRLEYSERLSRISKAIWEDSDSRRELVEKIRQGVLRDWEQMSLETRRNRGDEVSGGKAGMVIGTEIRRRMSETQSRRQAGRSVEERLEATKAMREAARAIQVPSGPEKQLWLFLGQSFPGLFIPDWVDRLDIGGRFPDFRTGNGCKLIIESFGGHWHDPEYSDRPIEEELIAIYKKEGWDCIVVWANSKWDTIAEWPGLAVRIREIIENNKEVK